MASLGYSPSDSYLPFHFSALPVPSLNEGGPVCPELAVSRTTLMPCFFLRLAASCPPVLPPATACLCVSSAAGVPKETFHGRKAWQLWGIEGQCHICSTHPRSTYPFFNRRQIDHLLPHRGRCETGAQHEGPGHDCAAGQSARMFLPGLRLAVALARLWPITQASNLDRKCQTWLASSAMAGIRWRSCRIVCAFRLGRLL